jgi:hypothetical protein
MKLMKSNFPVWLRNLPKHGWLGLSLVIVFWVLSWSLPGLRTHWTFFPLWLGYCLGVDAIVYTRKGDSLLTRNPRAYVGMFIISIVGWWLFEAINWRTQNWSYIGKENFSNFEYNFFASLSFSTVMPAVFGTAELVGTFNWVKRSELGFVIKPNSRTLLGFFFSGIGMFVLMLAWPRYFFPFVWLSIYYIIDPINYWMGHRSLASLVSKGDWRTVVSLFTGVLICGFFWEMWNYYSYPKWVYHVPFVDFARIFEMPLLGYGGYLPFSLELFALYHLIIGLFKRKNLEDYIQIINIGK